MNNKLRLALLGLATATLVACGGSGSSNRGATDGPADTGTTPPQENTDTPQERTISPEEEAVVDNRNEFTDEFCPNLSKLQEFGSPIDGQLCLNEAEQSAALSLSLSPVVSQFCPVAAQGFDMSGSFRGELLDNDVGYDFDSNAEGTLTFPLACLQEAAENFGDFGELIGGSNPITDQVCPLESADGEVDPANCFAEAVSGGPTLEPLFEQFCPQTGESSLNEVGVGTAVDCFREAADNFSDVQDLLTGPNPLTEAFCPEAAENAPIDPVACFTEAASGFGDGGLPGQDGNPLEPLLAQFCPETAGGDLGPSTPIDCFQEAGDNFSDIQDLLTGPNPLTEAFCPEESATGSVDPAACFMEAAEGFGDGGLPGQDGNPLEPLLAQFCPETAGGDLGPSTPLDCFSEAGDNFGDIQDLLTGPNPLTEAFCPEESATGSVDPAACFMEAAEGFGDGGLPGQDGNPLEPLLAQFCPETAGGDLGPSTPLDCFSEAGDNFGDIQDLLTGPNPLTEAFCPEESATGSVDPAACFMEAAEGFGDGGLPGQDGNPLEPLLAQFCPETAGGDLGPGTPLDCFSEAGDNFGDIQDLLTGPNPLTEAFCPEESATGSVDPAACFMEAAEGFGDGGLPGQDGNPLEPLLAQFCPETAGGDLGPSTPLDCFAEAGENFGDVQDLLLGSNPLTDAFCPEEAANAPIDPAACFMEAAGGFGGGELPGTDGNPLEPLLAQFCPNTAEGDLGPSTPLDCLTEAGGDFGDFTEFLDPLLQSNELTNALCPVESENGTVDPRACFIESLDNVNLLSTEMLGLFPDCSLLGGTSDEGNLSLTLGLGCLLDQSQDADANLLTDLVDGLLGLFP